MATERGLIIIRFVRSMGYYAAGDVAGFQPETAHTHVAKGHATYVDPADSPAPPAPADPVDETDPPNPTPTSTDGQGQGAPASEPPAPDQPPVPPAPETPAADEGDPLAGGIPEDWQALHGNTRKKLAKAITGAPVEGLDEADAIIAAEVQRRAANP